MVYSGLGNHAIVNFLPELFIDGDAKVFINNHIWVLYS